MQVIQAQATTMSDTEVVFAAQCPFCLKEVSVRIVKDDINESTHILHCEHSETFSLRILPQGASLGTRYEVKLRFKPTALPRSEQRSILFSLPAFNIGQRSFSESMENIRQIMKPQLL